jgi:hypothetical protein
MHKFTNPHKTTLQRSTLQVATRTVECKQKNGDKHFSILKSTPLNCSGEIPNFHPKSIRRDQQYAQAASVVWG